jgi:hypothetical protein
MPGQGPNSGDSPWLAPATQAWPASSCGSTQSRTAKGLCRFQLRSSGDGVSRSSAVLWEMALPPSPALPDYGLLATGLVLRR